MRGRGRLLVASFAALLSVGWAHAAERAVVRAKPSPHRPTAFGAPTSIDVAVRLRGGLDKPHAALALNALVGGLNGIFYLSPMRNTILREFFGIVRIPAHHPAVSTGPPAPRAVRAQEEQEFSSPTTGAFMHLGGLHAATAVWCLMVAAGRACDAKAALSGMTVLHAIQAGVGLVRTLYWADSRPNLWSLLGAGGGPTTAALILALVSFSAASFEPKVLLSQ